MLTLERAHPGAQKGKVGTVAQELYTTLTDLQAERTPDKLGWLVPVECGGA